MPAEAEEHPVIGGFNIYFLALPHFLALPLSIFNFLKIVFFILYNYFSRLLVLLLKLNKEYGWGKLIVES